MVLPTFIVIGATKSGTTALHRYLSDLPDVFTPPTKELRFFSAPERWRRGVGWYEQQFAGGEAFAVRGETSPQYTHAPRVPDVPQRMAQVVPDARLVYLVRQPVERLLSQYRYRVNRGREDRPPEQALLDPWYLDGSRYAYQLDRYLARFDPASIKVVTSERLRARPQEVLAEVAAFLGAAPVRHDVVPRGDNDGDDKEPQEPRSALVRRALRTLVPLGLPPQAAHRWSVRRVPGAAVPPPAVAPSVLDQLRGRLAEDAARMRPWLGDEVDAWALT